MCGIVGYVGPREAQPILMNGIKRLEYRGYDSAGIALMTDSGLIVHKSAGKIKQLEKLLEGNNIHSNFGISHTRWATHGEPNEQNAHPHTDASDEIALVHNGTFEGARTMAKRMKLKQKGSTDSEAMLMCLTKKRFLVQ